MKHLIFPLLVAMALNVGLVRVGLAAAEDYSFEATAEDFESGDKAVISVRLINKKTGEPVPNAVIFQSRLDMSPDDMADMVSPLTPLPSDEPGIYRFQTNLSMAGRWLLKLAAKVPGETETVRDEVIVVAVD